MNQRRQRWTDKVLAEGRRFLQKKSVQRLGKALVIGSLTYALIDHQLNKVRLWFRGLVETVETNVESLKEGVVERVDGVKQKVLDMRDRAPRQDSEWNPSVRDRDSSGIE